MTKKITRKGSKQLTDEERASQVASRTIPPVIPPVIAPVTAPVIAPEDEGDDEEGEYNGGRPPFFTKEVMDGVRAAQKRRKTLTPEERAEEIEATRLSMGMLLIAIVREMKGSLSCVSFGMLARQPLLPE